MTDDPHLGKPLPRHVPPKPHLRLRVRMALERLQRIIRLHQTRIAWALAGSLFLAIGLLCVGVGYRLWHIPAWYISQGLSAGRPLPELIVDYRASLAPILTVLVQALGGAFLLVTVLLGFGQLTLARESQTTERFSRAVEHLGHTDLAVRVGGIYTLERTALESQRESSGAIELVAAFVRDRCAYSPGGPAPEQNRHLPGDIEAALRVIGRREQKTRLDFRQWPDLSGIDLRGAILNGASFASLNLTDAHFDGAQLEGADFSRARLERTTFVGCRAAEAKFNSAELYSARLDGADLSRADLSYAFLTGTSLVNANLFWTKLYNAVLSQTVFKGARVQWADFTAAGFDRVHFEGTDLSLATNLYQWQVRGNYTDPHTVFPPLPKADKPAKQS